MHDLHDLDAALDAATRAAVAVALDALDAAHTTYRATRDAADSTPEQKRAAYAAYLEKSNEIYAEENAAISRNRIAAINAFDAATRDAALIAAHKRDEARRAGFAVAAIWAGDED